MELLRELSRWSHVVIGFLGLTAFWFPVFARKGGALHRRAGSVFIVCGYWVTATGALSCGLIAHKIFRLGVAEKNASSLAALVFLAYLSWVTFVMLRYSVGVLQTKRDPTDLDTPGWRLLAYSAIAASALVVAYAVLNPTPNAILLYALSPIGVGTGLPMLRYMAGRIASPRAWLYEHLSATLGAGIAFHTAFAVFGASRLVDLPEGGLLSVLPWILPAAVGTPATVLWKRHYQKKLGELGRAVEPDPIASTP